MNVLDHLLEFAQDDGNDAWARSAAAMKALDIINKGVTTGNMKAAIDAAFDEFKAFRKRRLN